MFSQFNTYPMEYDLYTFEKEFFLEDVDFSVSSVPYKSRPSPGQGVEMLRLPI